MVVEARTSEEEGRRPAPVCTCMAEMACVGCGETFSQDRMSYTEDGQMCLGCAQQQSIQQQLDEAAGNTPDAKEHRSFAYRILGFFLLLLAVNVVLYLADADMFLY
jgi:hypothetical protein